MFDPTNAKVEHDGCVKGGVVCTKTEGQGMNTKMENVGINLQRVITFVQDVSLYVIVLSFSILLLLIFFQKGHSHFG